jgi:hypothetical protein
VISRFHLAIEKLNSAAKREGRASTEQSELLEQHLAEAKLERRKYLEKAVPAFLVALRKNLANEVSALNEKLYSHCDLIRISGNQVTLNDILITSNTTDWFTVEACIEVTTDFSGEMVETTTWPQGQESTQKQLFLSGTGQHMRVVTDSTSYNASEYGYALITRFLEERQAIRERGAIK